MPNKMDNFDKIIKDKLDSFDVPFNEAHWVEMDAKLNAVKTVKLKQNISIAASVVAIVAISAYFLSVYLPTDNVVYTNDNQPENKEISIEKQHQQTNIDNVIKNKKHTKEETFENKKEILSEKLSEEEVNIQDNDVIENTSTQNNDEENTLTKNVNEKENDKTHNSIENENEEEKINFEIFSSLVCQDQQISFKSYVDGYNLSYNWVFGDGNTSNEAHPKHSYKSDGIYDVSLTVYNEKTNKTATKKIANAITVLPTPKKDFSYTEQSLVNDKNKIMYPYTTLFVDVKNIKAFIWDAGNGKTSTKSSPEFLFEKAGHYPVKVTLTHQSGCEVTFTKVVEVKQDIDLLAPTGFIPSSNINENTTFIPKALLGWEIKFEMIISDKLGNEIYRTSESTKPWNGKFNNTGEMLPEDTYVWKVITYDAKGLAHHHSGTIRLMNR